MSFGVGDHVARPNAARDSNRNSAVIDNPETEAECPLSLEADVGSAAARHSPCG